MTLNSILLITVTGMLIAGSVAVLFSWVFARMWCRPERRISFLTPADYDLFFEHVTFSSGGARLSGWFVPPRSRNHPCPTAILVHGWSSNAADMLPILSILNEADFGVLAFDARGHGVSSPDGPITLLKFAEDILAAIEYLQTRPDVDVNTLAVVGHSLGGSGAIVAASADSRIRAVVAASAFADVEAIARASLTRLHIPPWPFLRLVRHFLERWAGTSLQDLSPRKRVGRITVPLMLIHGDSDKFIPSSDLDMLYRSAENTRAQRLMVPGRRHWDLITDPRCARSVVAFLRESLPPDDVARNCANTLEASERQSNRARAEIVRRHAGMEPIMDSSGRG